MEVVIEYDPGINLQVFASSAVFKRANENVAAGDRGKHWKPLDNRTSHEVSAIWVVNAITATHPNYTLAKQSFEDKCVPKLELGNEVAGIPVTRSQVEIPGLSR